MPLVNNSSQLRFRLDIDVVRHGHGSSGSVFDRRLNVLDQRAAAVYVQSSAIHSRYQESAYACCTHHPRTTSQLYRDPESACGRLRRARRIVFRRVNVGFTAGQQHSVAALDQLHYFGSWLIHEEYEPVRLQPFRPPAHIEGANRRIFWIARVRNRNGNSRCHTILMLAYSSAVFFFRALVRSYFPYTQFHICAYRLASSTVLVANVSFGLTLLR